MKPYQVVGIYETMFDQGRERLELKSNYTFIQDFSSEKRPFHHTGHWKLENHFLGASDVILIDAIVSEDDTTGSRQTIGDRTLNVHERSGKLALALNEVADWYFVRVN